MRTLVTAIALVCSMSAVAADSLSESNPVMRSLTLKDNEVLLGAGLAYGTTDGDKEWKAGLAARYGLTDNLSIGLSGVHYRFIERADDETGLEMAFGAGLRGMYESKLNGDSLGYGADVYGKYVLTSDTALTFGASYIFWNEDNLDNKKEYQYHVGVMQNLMDKVTLSAGYTYRDLKDFTQDDAYSVDLGLNYALSKQMDVGVVASYTDFNPLKNQYDVDSTLEKSVGMYLTYRF